MRTPKPTLALAGFGVMSLAIAALTSAAPPSPPWFTWSTVVNNTDTMPPDNKKNFNSYNQPSVNERGLVVIRARSRGGEGGGGETVVNALGSGEEKQPVHGIYTRDMSVPVSPGAIVRILDRKTKVPQPNNLGTTFVETPSFPRIDMLSDTIATRGNHQPVWEYSGGKVGTTGIYTNPFDDLITGASKLGAVPDFGFFPVPGLDPPTMFDVFPGAPAVTGSTDESSTIVFKGNYTVDDPTPNDPIGKTGVYYRELINAVAGGTKPVVLIANNTVTKIPGTTQVFGSTSPPSAANGQVVFAGFDNEDAPTKGGIYLAQLAETPELRTLVSIGGRVPNESVKATFNGLGEGGAFDGRYVGFWGAWGTETRTVRLYCQTEGNKDRIAYCNRELACLGPDGKPVIDPDTGQPLILGDPASVCDDKDDPNWPICYQDKQVPVNQGIFVHDTAKGGTTRTVAKTGAKFDEFLFWNFSGKTPCTGGGHSEEGAEDDGEPARWRSSAFVAVSGQATAFKAAESGGEQGGCGSCHSGGSKGAAPPSPDHGQLVGIYLNRQPGQDIFTVLDTRTDGQALDPEAPADSIVTELGIEREGLRGNWLAVSAKMGVADGTEEDGMAGVYITNLSEK
jgi:hypothetical protein